MNEKKLRRIIGAALLTVMVCLATMALRIPSPMGGYVNLGDCFVLMAGWMLGPFWGFLAAGTGSALADLFGGSNFFAPGTFVVKGLVALVAALLGRALVKGLAPDLREKPLARRLLVLLTASIPAELVMIAGYLGYTALLLGRGSAALLSVPGNFMQAAIGVAASTLFTLALWRIPDFREHLGVLCSDKKPGSADADPTENAADAPSDNQDTED